MTDEQRIRLNRLVGESLGWQLAWLTPSGRLEEWNSAKRGRPEHFIRAIAPTDVFAWEDDDAGKLPAAWPDFAGNLSDAWGHIVPAATARGWVLSALAWLREDDRQVYVLMGIRHEGTDGCVGCVSGLATDAAECLCRAWLAACRIEVGEEASGD